MEGGASLGTTPVRPGSGASGSWGSGAGDRSATHGAHRAGPDLGGPVGAVGGALGVVIGAVARLRGSRPMHPEGAVLRAVLRRRGVLGGAAPGTASGVPWIDTAGEDDVVVRLSRGAGLPAGWPDVLGLALRHDGGDVLLSSAGMGPLVRHVFTPSRHAGRTGYSSLVPYRGPRGPVMIGAVARPPRAVPGDPEALASALSAEPLRVVLVWAGPTWAGLEGRWRPFARLDVGGPAGPTTDGPIRFDPLSPPPGLAMYDAVARLRDPAYTAGRLNHPTEDPDGRSLR